MRKKRFAALISLTVVMCLSLFAAVAYAATDMTQFGFPDVVAEKKIKAGEAKRISHSGIKIDIPAGAFSHDVLFQVLEGDNDALQAKAPDGETVIMNFAFRVINLETKQLVERFNVPVQFSFKDKDVNQGSIYWNVRLDGSVVPNSVPAVIEGRTLTHGVGGATVGWMITSPTSSIR